MTEKSYSWKVFAKSSKVKLNISRELQILDYQIIRNKELEKMNEGMKDEE